MVDGSKVRRDKAMKVLTIEFEKDKRIVNSEQ
jgi:hypothetical protein